MTNEHGLSQQAERFARAIASGKTQAAAYREAYPTSKKWADKTVHVKASMLAAEEKVRRRVAGLQAELAGKSVLKAADILRETARIALSSPAGLVRREVKGDKESLRFLMPDELHADVAAAVASVKVDELGRVEYKFWDKNASLERATKILGLYREDNDQKAGGLAALLAALQGNVVKPDPDAARPDPDEDGDDDVPA